MQAHLLDTRSQLLAAEAEKRACEQRALAPLVAQLHKALIELAQRDGFSEPAQLHAIRQKLVFPPILICFIKVMQVIPITK